MQREDWYSASRYPDRLADPKAVGRYAAQRALSRLKGLRRQATDVQLQMLDRIEELLQRKAAALAQVRRHLQIRAWLSVWLAVHVPTTIALIGAITAHVFSVFIYW